MDRLAQRTRVRFGLSLKAVTAHVKPKTCIRLRPEKTSCPTSYASTRSAYFPEIGFPTAKPGGHYRYVPCPQEHMDLIPASLVLRPTLPLCMGDSDTPRLCRGKYVLVQMLLHSFHRLPTWISSDWPIKAVNSEVDLPRPMYFVRACLSRKRLNSQFGRDL